MITTKPSTQPFFYPSSSNSDQFFLAWNTHLLKATDLTNAVEFDAEGGGYFTLQGPSILGASNWGKYD